MKRKLLLPKIFVFTLALVITSMSFELTAQTVVKVPISAITNTASYHQHIYVTAPGYYKVIRYFLVLGPVSGDPRVAFDACDVCFAAKRGYKQVGDLMVCNNCGQTFPSVRINVEKGGCNPAPLNRVVDGDNLIIKVEDIYSGSKFF